jgi:hypothetical protein
MSARLVAGAVLNIPGIRGKIDKDGKVVDAQITAQLRGVIDAIVNATDTGRAVGATLERHHPHRRLARLSLLELLTIRRGSSIQHRYQKVFTTSGSEMREVRANGEM